MTTTAYPEETMVIPRAETPETPVTPEPADPDEEPQPGTVPGTTPEEPGTDEPDEPGVDEPEESPGPDADNDE